jgi:CubicO group peptidase (beta-lactamase class C family)
MNTGLRICFICLALGPLATCESVRSPSADGHTGASEGIADAIRSFVRHRVEIEKQDVGLVVGIVDERGSSVVSSGKMDHGSGREVDGDTLFEIGSVTKTFTGLLLEDMVERGEMKLDDPVAEYLPSSVNVPTHNGKQISLLQLATHTSGLPDNADNLNPKRADNSRADYSAEQLDAFVSGYQLARDPGTRYEYSTVGIALLGQAIARKAGLDYESLVVDRICRPLHMESTRITLTPELRLRLAQGYNFKGYDVSHTDWGALEAGAALRSTANDMLKYVSANLNLGSSSLKPLMDRTHVPHFHAHLDTDTDLDTDIGVTWMIMHDSADTTIIGHGGLTRGFMTYVGFDKTRHRGVVVLCNSLDLDVPRIGRILLASEWSPQLRPQASPIKSSIDQYVGQYTISPAQATDTLSRHGVGIRREGDRLFVQVTGPTTWPKHVLIPPVTDELVAEAESVFFERLSGVRFTFSRDARGKITGFSGIYEGHAFTYNRISDLPPAISKPPQPSVPMKLDDAQLTACLGRYEFPTSAGNPNGVDLTISRETNHLVGQFSGKDVLQGAFDIFPASPTDFFIKVDGSRLTFVRNKSGKVTAVIYHQDGQADSTGKRLTGGTP